jgi:hypothetical protein
MPIPAQQQASTPANSAALRQPMPDTVRKPCNPAEPPPAEFPLIGLKLFKQQSQRT